MLSSGRGYLIRNSITLPDPYAWYARTILFRNHDIVHSHGHPYWWNIYMKTKKEQGTKRIHTVHQIYFKEDSANSKRWRTEKALNKRLFHVCRRMDLVIGVSKWLCSILEKKGINCRYIPNGVDLKMCNDANPAVFRKRYSLESDFFFFAGNASRLKRPDYFLKLAEAFPERKFVMCGVGIERLKAPKNVLGLGQLPYKETLSAMKACRAFVLPSSKEAFGSVLLEAMACRKPVCATDSTGMKELVSDGENGYLFKHNDIKDMIRKADMAWNNPDIGEKGHKTVKKKYDWKNIVEKIDSEYEEICK
jgi:glycosyltransferase involved in cell wall biosynthesis